MKPKWMHEDLNVIHTICTFAVHEPQNQYASHANIETHCPPLYLVSCPVEWTPDASHTLVHTVYGLVHALQLLSTGVPQQFSLLLYQLIRHVPHANNLFSSVDIVASDDGMVVRSGRHRNFDLRIFLGKSGEGVFNECLHASRASGPVAVVEVESFALQDEGADAILLQLASGPALEIVTLSIRTYLGLCDRLEGRERHVGAVRREGSVRRP